MSRWLPEIRRRLAGAGLDPAREAEIALELESHIDDRYREMRAQGVDDEEASRRALEEIREDVRMRADLAQVERHELPPAPLGDPRRRSPLADLMQDVRYALRSMRRNPGFAALAILTLALGVGATTVVYAIVDNMLLRPVPYDHIERLVRIFETNSDSERAGALYSASYPNLVDWQSRSRSFDAIGIYRSRSLILIEGDPERVTCGTATRGFFEAAGAVPMLGRSFTAADSASGAQKVMILSRGAWLRRFGGDPNIIGRSVRTVDGSYEIIGVLGPARMLGAELELWTPFQVAPTTMKRDARVLFVVARLREGVTLDEARNEMNTIAGSLASDHADNRGWGVMVMPMQEWRVRGVSQPLYTFLGAVGCILLIACANVAGLLVARGAGRAGEIAIRSSLGARQWRIVRQLVTESVVLALAGGSAGALLAWMAIGALLPLFPVTLPQAWIAVDLRVLATAVTASGVTGVLFGLAPSLALSRSATAATLKDQARSTPRWGRRIGSGLIVIEVALSLVLLAGAGLLLRTLMKLNAVDPGIDDRGLVALRATPLVGADAPPERTREFYRQLVERVAAAPGVASAAAVSTPPFGGSTAITEAVSDVVATPTAVSPRAVVPRYFATMGITLRGGRDFDSGDTAAGSKVVIINETAASKLWPDQSPLGRALRFSIRGKTSDPYEVVGVVSDARHDGLDYEALAEIYQPLSQRPESDLTVVARAADPDALGRQFRALTTDLPERALVRPYQTFAAMIGGTLQQRRNRTLLLSILAALGMVLAAVGVFGLTAYGVTQRRKEIGVRMALGASSGRVLRTVVGSQLPPLGAGVLLGLAGSWWATRALRAFLFGIEPADAVSFSAAALLISLAALIACYLPARRAVRVDPVIALRTE
jgi:putative ABC transport system permease protein